MSDDLVIRLRNSAEVCTRAAPEYQGGVKRLFETTADGFTQAADEIERLRVAMTAACSDMGCYCADDDPLPDNLKCPMCKLEKALHG